MAGIHDINVIDLVAQDAAGEYMLVMIEDRPWGSDPSRQLSYARKMNTYAGYVLDGGLTRQYPQTAGQHIHIRLDCITQPTDEIAVILDHTAAKLDELGMSLLVNVRG